MKLKLDEQETILSLTGIDRSNKDKWIVTSDDPVMINKLDKISDNRKQVGLYGAIQFELDFNQVSFRKKKTGKRKELSIEKKEELRQRMSNARTKKKTIE